MDWIVENWPIVLAAIGIFVVVAGLIKKLVKLAIFGTVLVVGGFFLLQVLSS